MPGKTEIYTWRVSPTVKSRLEEAARVRRQSVARLLDELVTQGLDNASSEGDTHEVEQHRLHAQARRFLGCISGGHARRSERVRELVRARLKRRVHTARE